MGFLNAAILWGLAAVAVPIVIHLWNRRRFDVIDWGAMQFLQFSVKQRRRLRLEEILLLAARVGIVGLLVLALAGPITQSAWLTDLAGRPPHDVVLILDGSYSMGSLDDGKPTPFAQARQWALEFLDQLRPGDRVAVLVADAVPRNTLGEPTADLDRVRSALRNLQEPHRNGSWPAAIQAALHLLKDRRDSSPATLVLLRDTQRHGWADEATVRQWEILAPAIRADDDLRLRVVEFARARPASLPNFALAPLQPLRRVVRAGQEGTVRSALVLQGFAAPQRPWKIRKEIDGQPAGEVEVPAVELTQGQALLSFTLKLDKPGRHVVALTLEPEAPGAARIDHLPGDNRQQTTIEVMHDLPVLIVDGADPATPESSSFFLSRALMSAQDDKSGASVRVTAVQARDFRPSLLADEKSRPRVLVLAETPPLADDQLQAVTRFVADGGGLLIALGPKTRDHVRWYNEVVLIQGWLPARLEEAVVEIEHPERWASPDTSRLSHPALEVFAQRQAGALGQVRFGGWWRVAPGKKAAIAAFLTSLDPWLVEQEYGKGRVLLCSTPLDRAWNSTLPGTGEFPVLAHEWISYLADPGRTTGDEGLDLRESDLTPCTDEDRRRVENILPLEYHDAGAEFSLAHESSRQDWWWLLLVGVALLMLVEMGLTRHLRKSELPALVSSEGPR